MKHRLLLFAAICCTLASTSCNKEKISQEEQKPAEKALSVSPLTLNFTAEASEKTFTVNTVDSWTVSASDRWITVSPTSGNNKQSVTVSVASNEAATADTPDRNGTVTITSKEGKSASVKISQSGQKKPVAPTVTAISTSKWELTSSVVSSGNWASGNKFTANMGSLKTAYISTEKGNAGSTEPQRSTANSSLSVSNLTTGDMICFTLPSVTIAAGSSVDFMTSIMARTSSSPKYWIFEYQDGGVWKSVEKDLYSDGDVKYSFYIKYFSAENYTNFIQHFTLENDIVDSDLKMRIRAVGSVNNGGGSLSANSSAYINFVNMRYGACYINVYQGIPVRDTKKVLVLGNSFTYYYATNFMLKEIARSQGHEMDMRANLKGSQYFRQHSALELSQFAVNEGGYDYALLQDQSGQHATYFSNPATHADVLSETKTLVNSIKAKSPAVNVIIENTWGFKGSNNYEGFGSFEAFDNALQGGALLITDALDTWMSPINAAFQKARAAGISLYYTDDKHPGRNGAYLKSCVNYLLLYGQAFTATVSDALVDAATAAKLRAIAEEVVLGHESEYRNPDSSKVVPGGDTPDPGTGEFDPDNIQKGDNGISNAIQLLSFAYLWNTGGDVSSYKDASGNVKLLADIDLGGKSWAPIGGHTSCAYQETTTPAARPFTGTFDGNGKTIKGLKLAVNDNKTNTCGFFGALLQATVKNLKFTDVTLDYTATGISSNHIALGTVVGYMYDAVLDNIEVTASFSGLVTSTGAKHVSLGGIAGMAVSSKAMPCAIRNCTFNGSITNDIGSKYSNSNTACVGGIIASISGKSPDMVEITNCRNNATIDVKAHHIGGIIANTFATHITGCVNAGNVTANYSSSRTVDSSINGVRLGGIMGYCSSQSKTSYTNWVDNCTNTATIASSEAASWVGGVAGLIKCFTLKNSTNKGNVIAPAGCGALLIGVIQSSTTQSDVSNCYIKGSIGTSASSLKAVTASDYFDYAANLASGVSCPTLTKDNVKFCTE